MLPQEFEPAYKASKSEEERWTVLQIAGDWCEERGDLASAELCRGHTLIPLIWCSSGKFQMGRSKNEDGPYGDHEKPVDVTLTQGFWLGEYCLTQEQWRQVMGGSIQDQAQLRKASLYGEGPNFPMYHVNWNEAKEFCERYTKEKRNTGRLPKGWVYDLPTEAQWEYACRAGSTTQFGFGDDEASLDEYAWYNANSKMQNHEVGEKKANDWGLHDMHGHVWEWCRDEYQIELPGGVDPFTTSETHSARACRGGSWNSGAWLCRSAYRIKNTPDTRSIYLGFRLALVLDAYSFYV